MKGKWIVVIILIVALLALAAGTVVPEAVNHYAGGTIRAGQ